MKSCPEVRDESVSFSLGELRRLEAERIEEEAELRAKALSAARDAAAARTRIEGEDLARALRQANENEARRDALQRALVEQARISVEARTRADEAEFSRRHEVELERIRAVHVAHPSAYGSLIGSAFGGAALALGGCLIVYFSVSAPASQSKIAEAKREVVSERERAEGLAERVDRQRDVVAELERRTQKAPDEPPVLKSPLMAAPAHATANPRPTTTPTKPPRAHEPDGNPCLYKFDPLCGHIDTH